MHSYSKATSSARDNTDAMLVDKHSAAFSTSTTGPFIANNNDGDIDHINHQFDNMDFNKVRVVGADLEGYAELQCNK